MPYIEKKYRKNLDPLIDKLADKIISECQGDEGSFAGLINYSCTRLSLGVVKGRFGKMRYWILASLTGVFKNISDELYRRVGVPYEEIKIKENGDLEEYQEFYETHAKRDRG